MKSKIFNLIISLLCIPVIVLCGCSNKRSELPKIASAAYLENTVTYTSYDSTKEQTLDISEFLLDKVEPLNIRAFEQVTITAKSAWIYKMYIDRIYFNFYSNKTTDSEMIIKLTMTNLVNEENIGNSNSIETIELNFPFIAKAGGSVLCIFDIEKTVATATGSKITIDIYESLNNDLIASEFKWTIYGLEIYGEHRTYSQTNKTA